MAETVAEYPHRCTGRIKVASSRFLLDQYQARRLPERNRPTGTGFSFALAQRQCRRCETRR